MIEDCQNEYYWGLEAGAEKFNIKAILESQETFDAWCKEQKEIDNSNPVKLRQILCNYAALLSEVNKRGYTLDGPFCKRVELDRILGSIHLKGATPCCCCHRTETEKYIDCLECIIEYGF